MDQLHVAELTGAPVVGYLARPVAPAVAPAVVVIQEWWGLNDHIKALTRRFALAGFVALAPDLYHGQVANEPDFILRSRLGTSASMGKARLSAAMSGPTLVAGKRPKSSSRSP